MTIRRPPASIISRKPSCALLLDLLTIFACAWCGTADTSQSPEAVATLQQFELAVSNANSGDTIVLSTHDAAPLLLDCPVNGLGVPVTKSLTISAAPSSSVTFDCRGRGRALLVSGTQVSVTVVGIAFHNGDTSVAEPAANAVGGAIFVHGGASLHISRCSFSNNRAMNGGAVFFLATSFGTITADSGTVFSQCSAGSAGGAIAVQCNSFCEGVTVLNTDVMYNNNAAVYGGGISITYGDNSASTVHIFNGSTSFINNIAIESGGGVSIYYSMLARHTQSVFSGPMLFRGNRATSQTAYAGAIEVFYEMDALYTMTVVGPGLVFEDNIAVGNDAGALIVVFKANVFNDTTKMVSSTFSGNMAHLGAGGAVNVAYGDGWYNWTSVVIEDCVFRDNAAAAAGAVIVRAEGLAYVLHHTFRMRGSSFISNKGYNGTNAVVGAGAVGLIQDAGNGSVIEISSTQFINNSVQAYGGGGLLVAMPLDESPQSKCRFCQGSTNNYWPVAGCGWPHDKSLCQQVPGLANSSSMILTHFIPIIYHSTVTLSEVTFRGNTATCDSCQGGAVIIKDGNATVNNCVFIDNTANLGAGALHSDGQGDDSGGLHLADLYFLNNTARYQSVLSIKVFGAATVSNITIVAIPPIDRVGQTYTPFFLETSGNQPTLTSVSLSCPPGYNMGNQSFGLQSVPFKGWPSLMLKTSIDIFCSPCAPDQYSLENGHLEHGIIHGITCRSCPFGGSCAGVGPEVRVSRDFWGVPALSPRFDDQLVWMFTQCPGGFCCPTKDCSIQVGNDVSCNLGRNGSVPLCGACLDGHAPDLAVSACYPNDQCRRDALLAPLAVIVAFVWAILLATWPPLFYMNRHRFKVWSTLIFYFQSIPLVLFDGFQRDDPARLLLFGLNMRIVEENQGGGSDIWKPFCIPGLSPIGRLWLELLLPLMVAAALGILAVVRRLYQMLQTRRTIELPFKLQRRISQGIAALPAAHYDVALLRLVLFSYTSIAKTVMSLLTCVRVQGVPGMRIWKAPDIVCYQHFQIWVWLLFCFVVLPFPLVQGLWIRRMKGLNWQVDNDVSNPLVSAGTSSERLLAHLTADYVPNRWYWSAVVSLRRLLLTMIFSFLGASGAMSQSVTFTFILALFALHESHARPYANTASVLFSTSTLVILCAMALCSIWFAAAKSLAATVVEGSISEEIQHAMQLIQAVTFWLPLIPPSVALTLSGYNRYKAKRNRNLNSRGRDGIIDERDSQLEGVYPHRVAIVESLSVERINDDSIDDDRDSSLEVQPQVVPRVVVSTDGPGGQA